MVKRFGAGQVGIQPASSRFRAGAVVGRPVSQQLIFQPQDTTEQQRQALSLESLSSIEDKIKWFEQIAEHKRQEIVTLAEQGRDTSRAREQYEQQRFISDVNIDKLRGIKSLAQQGQYTTTSLLAYASAQAGGRLDRAEMTKILREQEMQKAKVAQQEYAKEAQYYQTTKEGVIDTRTGEIVTGTGTGIITGGGGRVEPEIKRNIFGQPIYQSSAQQEFFEQAGSGKQLLPTTETGVEELTLPGQVEGEFYLTQKVTETFIAPDGKEIPITKVYLTDSSGKIIREASEIERQQYESGTRVLTEDAARVPGFIEKIKRTQTYQNIGGVLGQQWLDNKEVMEIQEKQTQQLSGIVPAPLAEFSMGALYSLVPKTKGELARDVALFGVGAGVGAGLKFSEKGAIALSRVSVLGKAGKYVVPTYKITELTAGVGLTGIYGASVYQQYKGVDDYTKKGEIIGTSIKDLTLVGAGIGAGKKGAERVFGYIATRGRVEIPIERLTSPQVLSGEKSFPTALKYQQLSLFEKRGGGFHVTPSKFWKGKITPDYGKAEFPGLYVSSELSIHFAKLQGESAFKLFPSVKNLFTIESSPATAFLKPKGFRTVAFEFKSIPLFEGQKSVRGKYAEFTTPAKEGIIDLPLLKTEIEGLARVEAGDYALTSKDIYTTIKGTRVPIDIFKPETLSIKGETPSTKTLKSKGFSSKDYSVSIEKSAIYTPSSTALSSIMKPSKVSYTPSYKTYPSISPTPSLTYSKIVSKPSTTSYTPSKVSHYKLTPSLTYSKIVSKPSTTSYTPTSYSDYSYKGGTSYGGETFKTTTVRKDYLKKGIKKQPKFEVGLYRYIGGKRKRLSLGTGSLQQVFALGKHRTETTLARTFQIRKVSGDPIKSLTIPFKFRKGFTPMTKKPATFVQKAKFSLGTIGEKREIHRARKRKKKK